METAEEPGPPRVVVGSGHMVDVPDRSQPRFPPAQVPRVTAEVGRALERWHVGEGTVVICGGARGADIIVAEGALARGAQVVVCLALPPDEFERQSVELPGSDWSARFRRLLDTAEVRQLDDGAGPAGDGVFARTNQWMVETATSLAGGRPHAVVVWDGQGGDGLGGTADLLRRVGYKGPDKALAVIDPTPRDYESRQDPEGPKKLLSLDGGGIRGVLSLQILAAIETGLRRQLDNEDLVLGDYFDYIGGTSTGAIIATGLAAGMTVEALARSYRELGEKSFARSFLPIRALYKGDDVGEQLRTVFGDRTLGDPKLRALLLMVMHNTVTDSAWPLSNCTQAVYNRADRYLLEKPDRNLDLRLTQLLRASTAAPVYFPPETIVVGKNTFVFQDGGITPFNNPALLLFLMATLPEYGLEWKVGDDKILVVSVGTGAAPAEHTGLTRSQVGYFFNARNLTSVFMNGASVGQDVLCRSLGDVRFGESIDREFGARLNVTGIAGTNLFSYVRYNADLSDRALEKRGITQARERKRIRKLDGVKAMGRLQEIGRSVGTTVDVPAHFKGFL